MNRVVFFLFLTACGTDMPTEMPPGTTPSDDVETTDPFADFQWEKTNKKLEGAAAFSETEGRNMFIATLFVMKTGDFVLYYVEGNGDVTLFGHSGSTNPDTARKKRGTWRVSGQELRLGDTMTCAIGPSVNGKGSLNCTLKTALGLSAAVAATARVTVGFEGGPNDSEWSSYRE